MRRAVLLVLAGCLSTPPPPACSQARAIDELNDDYDQFSPWLSADRRELLYATNSNSIAGQIRIVQATRDAPAGAFGPPTVFLFDQGSSTFDPAVSADELTVWYIVGDPMGGGPIWHATRPAKLEPFTGDAPVFPELGMFVLHPTLTADQLTIYYVQLQLDTSFHDIWVATRASTADPWSNAHAVIADDTLDEEGPSISADGETLLYEVNGTGGVSQIVAATRAHGFADAVPVAAIDHDPGGNDVLGSLHADGRTIVFASDRGREDLDLYIACE